MKRNSSATARVRAAWLWCVISLSAFTGLGQTTPPSNDAFTNRLAVSGLQVVAMGTNTYATAETGEPAHAGQTARHSMWWSWLAPYDGIAQLTVTNVGMPRTKWAVYLGNTLTNLSLVASNMTATNRVVEFPIQAGLTYQIAVDEQYPYGTGAFTLWLKLATVLLTQPTAEARIPSGRPYRLAVANREADHALARVDYFASSNWLGSATEAPFSFDWTPGIPSRTNLSAVATNSLGERRESPVVWVTIIPPNDNFADAFAIPAAAVSGSLTGSNALASAEAFEPAHGGKIAARSLWWSWTPAYCGRANIKITSSPSQPRVAVYTGTALSNLVAVASATASAAPVEVGFDAAAGTTYFIAIDSNTSLVGALTAQFALTTLRFVSPPPATRVLVTQPVELVVTNYEADHPLASLELVMNASNTVASGWSPPWRLVWTTNVPGLYAFSAYGTNSLGELRLSETNTVLVSPANDDFTNALELPSLPDTVVSADSTTAFATHEVGEPVHLTASAKGSVWFTWVSPWNGDILFSTAGSQSGPILVVYSGDALTNLVALTTAYSSVAHVNQGQRYYIAMDAMSGYQGPVRLSILPPPPNNDFANAIELSGIAGDFSGANHSASSEPGEPVSAPENSASVWWRWTAPATGDCSFNTAGSLGMTVQAAVYTGPSVSNLTAVVAPMIISSLSGGGSGTYSGSGFRAYAGMTYYFRFSGGISQYYESFGLYGTIAGTFSFTALPNIPINDAFAGRLQLTGMTNFVLADNSLASSEAGEPHPNSCDAAGRTLWWTYTAPEAGLLRVSAAGLSNSVVCALYRGNALDQLQSVGFSCTGPLEVMVQAGDAFVIQVDGAFAKAGGLILQTILYTAASNDNFADSVHLEGTNVTAHGDPTACTFEPNEPNPGATNTVWFSWVAPVTGRVWFSPGPNVGLPMAVYTGPTLDRLTAVRLVSNDNGVFCFLAREGTVYHFQYSGGGAFDLSVHVEPYGPCTNDDFASAQVIKGPYSTDRRSVVGATMEPGEPAHLGARAAKSIWWKWQAPVNGVIGFYPERSLVPEVILAVYRGAAVEALTLVAKGTNYVSFSVTGGETYCLAGAVAADAVGDVSIYWGYNSSSSASIPVPGNLLREPSWEGTRVLGAQYWGMSGQIGSFVNYAGGADGTTWPALTTSAQIWQDFATVPGQNHAIRFALTGAAGPIRVTWDGQEVGLASIPPDESSYWHWAYFTAYASNTTSRIQFENLGGYMQMDAFSVVSLTAPPQLVTQPTSTSVIKGSTAAFSVGVNGSAPLTYTWYFNGAVLVVRPNGILTLESVATNQAGTYRAVISNPFGAVTSAPVSLVVEAPAAPVILWQPYGDNVGVGGYYNFSVVGAGTLPLSYQWFKDAAELNGATNRNLAFLSLGLTNAGIYSVRVQNNAGIAWSLGARLVVTDTIAGGGQIRFANQSYDSYGTNVDAPVFDIDGTTHLNGSNYVAQLYAGSSLGLLRPAGQPSAFKGGFGAGYFFPQFVTLPAVPPGSNAIVQVRAWDARMGSSYEEARATGARFGKSGLLTVMAGGGLMLPTDLDGLQSFSLQAGMPQFASGQISFVEQRPEGVIVWSHRGEPGFQYVIEKSIQGFEWRPYLVITNTTSTVTFTDTADNGSTVIFYRSRILD